MRKWLPSMLAAPVVVCAALVTVGAAPQEDQASALLEQIRAALGGDRLAAVKTLAIEGSYRQVMGENERSGDLELLFAMPDRYQRIEQIPTPTGMPGPRIATTLDGGEAWMGPLGPIPGGMMMRFGPGPGGPSGPGGPGGPQGQGRRFDPLPRVRAEYWRVALAILPGSAATSALKFTYVGKAEAPDGQAEVLDVTGEGGFAARLFVDAASYLPIMMTYQDRDLSQMRPQQFRRREGETPEQMRQRIEEERKKREAAGPPPPPPMVEHTMFIADHQEVDGLQIPGRIAIQVGDKPTQEWELKKVKVNAKLEEDQFKRKSSE
ncbi:MAG TPA: hypothetical protein VIL35_00920 [Vicinamibacterales bacterium]